LKELIADFALLIFEISLSIDAIENLYK